MAYARLLLLLLLSCTVLPCCKQESRKREWTNYTAPDKKFSIDLPKGYKTHTSTHETESGSKPMHFLSWSFAAPFQLKGVDEIDIRLIELSYYDLPREVQERAAGALLDISMERFLKEQRHPFVKYMIPVSDITLSGYPGKYFVAEKDANKTKNQAFFVKKYLVRDRMYTIRVVGYIGNYRPSEIDSFFNSFKIYN